MPDNPRFTINLIPRKKKTFAERFVYWLLTFGRYIIIGTELVVFAVFISRFQLDTKLSDLNDAIRNEEAIVQSLEDDEKAARSLQIRLSEIKRLDSLQKDMSPRDVLSLISSFTPQTVSFDRLSLEGETITIHGVSISNTGFSVFIQNLRTESSLRNVSITGVSKDEVTGGIRFTVLASLVREENGSF